MQCLEGQHQGRQQQQELTFKKFKSRKAESSARHHNRSVGALWERDKKSDSREVADGFDVVLGLLVGVFGAGFGVECVAGVDEGARP